MLHRRLKKKIVTLMHRMDKTDTVLLIYEKENYNRQLHQALLDLPIPLPLSLSPSVMMLRAESSQ